MSDLTKEQQKRRHKDAALLASAHALQGLLASGKYPIASLGDNAHITLLAAKLGFSLVDRISTAFEEPEDEANN